MKFFETPIWTFLSLIIIAWITQRIASAWEKRKKIEETRLELFMSWQPFLAEVYACTQYPDDAFISPKEFLKKKMEILGTIQIMGPEGGIDAGIAFFDLAEKGLKKNADFDSKVFHRSYTELNYQLCCEIHGEKNRKC